MSSNGLNMLTLSPEQAELLALLIEEQSLSSAQATTIVPRPNVTDYPLSFAQGRLWFLHQMAPTSPLYNIPLTLRCEGVLNVPVLERVLSEILRRHEVLRATFRNVGGEPIQAIAAPQPQQIPVIDLSTLPNAERERALQEQIRTAASTPFDLEHGPLLRIQLLRLTATDHVLLILMHHIVTDGVSCGVLMQELAALYTAFVNGQPSPLPELKIQFADFTHWQREWLQGDVLAEQLTFWRQQLAGAPAILELPTAPSGRPPVQTYWGDRRSLTLPLPLSEALHALSRQQEVTLFATLLAAFKVLLARYTHQADIVVGTPVANRNRPGLADLIGMFVNTLALRTDLSANPTVSDLLAQVGTTVLQAYEHQELPFEQLVETLQPVRNLSHSPLFQVMFNYLPTPVTTVHLPNLTVRTLEYPTGIAKFDLTLTVEERAKTLTIALEYNTDLFTGETIQRMLGHYQTLLTGMVANPAQRVSELPLLTPAEIAQVVGWNDTHAEYQSNVCLHQLFEEQAARTPDALAVVFGGEQLTYRELNQRANQLAYYLQAHGVGSPASAETVVGVCTERNLDMIIAKLAILKAGGAYLPLDPAYPDERLAFMMTDAQIPLLLTQSALIEKRPAFVAAFTNQPAACAPHAVICLDTDWETIARSCPHPGQAANPPSKVTAEQLAYVIYTSGSTGRPKGVAVIHRTVVNLITWYHQAYALTAADRTTQVSGMAFDASVWEIWPTLTRGACLYIADDITRLAPSKLVAWLVAQRITVCFLPTPLAEAVLDEPWPAETALRYLATGGDALHRQPPATLPFTLVNNYGPTENTVAATWTPVESGDSGQTPSIGQPLANVQVYIVDQHLNPLPVGVPGELYIAGDGLARGYLNRPEITAERFIPNPFSAQPGARLYRTGDLARYLPASNGCANIEFLGRIDHQVKVRGFRIELGEIEAVLAQHPALAQAVVLAERTDAGDHRLAAYVVPQATPPESDELRHFLRAKLPEYMIPANFLCLDKLPLTPNGKVDRAALPAFKSDGGVRAATFVAPRTALETTLAEIWAAILPVEAVGIHDNFFDLGGHSLLITQIVSRVEETFQVKVPLQAFFEIPTVAHLALVVEQAQGAPQTEVVTIQRVARNAEQELLGTLDELSEAEIEALLSTMLQTA